MNKNIISSYIKLIFIALVTVVFAGSIIGQKPDELTPETQNSDYMTYQGRLLNAGSPANGNYDFEFKIINGSGTVIQTIQALGVSVTNGIFTARFPVNISTFSANSVTSLSVGVRQLPTDQFTPLAPSQPVSAAPVAFRAHYAMSAGTASSADTLNGIAPNQLVQIDDPRLSDARQPLPGSTGYIQNGTTLQTAGFNISGIGNADILNARSYYALDGFIVLASPGSGNLFAGVNAGASNTTGSDNSIFGREAGANNATGSGNAFFGNGAGKYSTVDGNSFFGKHAGYFTTTGYANSFFGFEAGQANTSGYGNTFVGSKAGRVSTTASYNTFVGNTSGGLTTTGSGNAFFGSGSGSFNTTGSFNVFVGDNAGDANSIGDRNVFVGASAGDNNTSGSDNVFIGDYAGGRNTTGSRNIYIGFSSGGDFDETGNDNVLIGHNADAGSNVSNSVAIGKAARVDLSNQIVLGTTTQNTLVSGKLGIGTVPTGGSAALCLNPSDKVVSLCSSSIRFKENVTDFTTGLDLIKRLRPVSFTWKQGGMRDVGFVAEEVAEAEPLLASRDSNGDVQGVKYDRISTALVNGVNQQQEQIESLRTTVEAQQKQLAEQRAQIDALRLLVCAPHRSASICKEKE